MQVHRVGALLEEEAVASLAGRELLARQSGRLHGILQVALLACEAVHGEADQHADDDVADRGDDVVLEITLMDAEERDGRDQRRPERDDDPAAQSQEVGAGHHERRAEDLHDLQREEKGGKRIPEREQDHDSADAVSAQRDLQGRAGVSTGAPSGPS